MKKEVGRLGLSARWVQQCSWDMYAKRLSVSHYRRRLDRMSSQYLREAERLIAGTIYMQIYR